MMVIGKKRNFFTIENLVSSSSTGAQKTTGLFLFHTKTVAIARNSSSHKFCFFNLKHPKIEPVALLVNLFVCTSGAVSGKLF